VVKLNDLAVGLHFFPISARWPFAVTGVPPLATVLRASLAASRARVRETSGSGRW